MKDAGLKIDDICTLNATATRITVMNVGTIAHASCTLAGEGASVSCGTLDIGGVGSYVLNAPLDVGDSVSSIFTIDTGAGIASCQGSSFVIPVEGISDC